MHDWLNGQILLLVIEIDMGAAIFILPDEY
jgi:hypothetical protein